MAEVIPNAGRLERGVVYIATGEACRHEAIRSARSFRRHNPLVPIAIFTETKFVDPIFNYTLTIEEPDFSTVDKMRNLWKTPFQETVFLDADTFVTGDISQLFEILERVDFAGTHETARGFWYKEFQGRIPDAFCELNGGMLVFKATPAVLEMLKDWYAAYLETTQWLSRYGSSKWMLTNDQPSLRHLLYHRRDVKLWVLPTEYNALRFWGTYLWGKALIVHGRGQIDQVADSMNEYAGVNRSYLPGCGTWPPVEHISLGRLLKNYLRFNAIMVRAIFRRVFGRVVRNK